MSKYSVWVRKHRPQNLLTAPIIYGMIVPLFVLDLSVTLYQAICFPIYRIAKVRRRDYFVFDRHRLSYLGWIDKFHCTYCSYANGLIAYSAEILGRTEEYFCPIKHARKLHGRHTRYMSFLEFGAVDNYEEKLDQRRLTMGDKARKNASQEPDDPV